MKILKNLPTLLIAGMLITGCGGSGSDQNGEASSSSSQEPQTEAKTEQSTDPMDNKGIGPVKNVSLDEEVDEALVKKGKQIYEEKCTACHKPDTRYIGPAPKGILERRSPEWIMNMILNPEEMVKKDPDAKKLLMEFNGAPMANQNLTREEARAILEYFRTLN